MEIRSYRRVFDLERRVYSIDSLRLNPTGVPVRGIVYFVVIMACSMATGRLPVVGELARALPWYLRDLALPAASATVLSAIRLEGRTFHLAAGGAVRYWAGPRRLACLRRCAPPGQRWRPEELLLLPDGSDSCMRRLRYAGPGAVRVAIAHELVDRAAGNGSVGLARRRSRRALSVRALPGGQVLAQGKVILLGQGTHLRVRPPTAGDGGG
jgi:hypothetical protein